jgi:hypothetical protein
MKKKKRMMTMNKLLFFEKISALVHRGSLETSGVLEISLLLLFGDLEGVSLCG